MDDDACINMEIFISFELENNNDQQTQEEEKAKTMQDVFGAILTHLRKIKCIGFIHGASLA